MKQLQAVNHVGKRVLTTSQLAASYGTESDRISKNFHENKERFTEGKHFFKLEGEDLLHFRNSEPQITVSNMTRVLYLWTEKGAWMHAKSLNTDQAWNAYEALVDDYYNVKLNTQALSPELQMFSQIFQSVARMELANAEQSQRITQVEKKLDDTAEILALNPVDGRKKVTSLLNRIAQTLGGGSSYQDVRAESYQKLEDRAECNLSIRQTNKRKKMALEGVAKSRIDKVSKLDVIFDDGRLTEIYFAIVKEMAVQNRIDASA